MAKLTTEITIEELQYRINAHENDLTQMWTADYFLSVQKELLALKQAAKNPVAWVATDSEDFPEYNSHNEFSADCGAGTPLYSAPVLPKQPELLSIGELLQRLEEQTGEKWVEESSQPVSEPYKLPSGYALVPCKLTAENGAKSCMIGEFTEQTEISCPECLGDDECETCDGSGMIEVTVPVSWTTIKDIWVKGIEHFAAAADQEQKS